MPTRYLLQNYFSTVSAIKPLFLMSPLSVSTYLSPSAQFDLVVFDEASQIFPEDALGAIYRGKQAIIVGDEHQLPPTSFFMKENAMKIEHVCINVADIEKEKDFYCQLFDFRPSAKYHNAKTGWENYFLSSPTGEARLELLSHEFCWKKKKPSRLRVTAKSFILV